MMKRSSHLKSNVSLSVIMAASALPLTASAKLELPYNGFRPSAIVKTNGHRGLVKRLTYIIQR